MDTLALFILLFILIPVSGYVTAKLAAKGWLRGLRKPKHKEGNDA